MGYLRGTSGRGGLGGMFGETIWQTYFGETFEGRLGEIFIIKKDVSGEHLDGRHFGDNFWKGWIEILGAEDRVGMLGERHLEECFWRRLLG